MGKRSSVTCTRRLQFCMGHRVVGHEGKCAHLHGHNYVALLSAEAKKLDDVGRVIDFGVLKDRIGSWIEKHWDHGSVTAPHDAELIRALHGLGGKVYVLDANPTAENLARHLFETGNRLLAGTGVRLMRVRLWETENCYADYGEI